MSGSDDQTPDAGEAEETKPKTRYEQGQAEYRARWGESKKRYKGRWRGKPRRRRKLKGRHVDHGRIIYEQLRRHVPLKTIHLERLEQRWPQLVTPRIAKRTRPVKLLGRLLVVVVHDNQWLHELRYLRQDILERLAQELPDLQIEALELKLRKLPETDTEGPVAEPLPRYEPPLSGEVPASTVEAIESVKDPALREAMRRARDAFGGKTD